MKDFGEFALTTNNVFISPQAMANYLFKFKGSCSVKENETIRELKRNITAWKDANGNNKYIVIKHQPDNDVGVGMGGEVGSHANKKLTKQAFKQPMKNLASSLEMLYKAIHNGDLDAADTRLKEDVTQQFKKIAEIVNYAGRPCYGTEEDNEEEDDDEEEEDDEKCQMEMDGQSKDDSKIPEHREHSESDDSKSRRDEYSSSDSSDDKTGGGESEIEQNNEKQDEHEDNSSNDDDQKNNPGNDTNAENNNDDDTLHLLTYKDVDRNHIAKFVTYMQTKGLDISESTMSGKQIKEALDLTVAPKLCSKERNYFYIMQSESLETIKKEYKQHNPDTPNDSEQDAITEFDILIP